MRSGLHNGGCKARLLNGAASLLLLLAVVPASFGAENKIAVDLPAQTLNTALRQLARDGAIDIVFDPALVSGKQSPRLQGRYTSSEALDILISDSGLQATQAAEGKYVLSEATTPEVENVVVTAYRWQNQQAAAAKRSENRIADFLNSDEIGRQADYNIADSFRRIPGVMTVFDEDEGHAVAVRGLNPDYTVGTFDGSYVATSERGTRRLNLEVVPSSAVQRLEVIKSRNADTEGNAIGGTINLVTRSAFDSDGVYFVADAMVGMSDSTAVPGKGYHRNSDDGISFRLEASGSFRFGRNGEFGIFATGSFLRKRRDEERVTWGNYSYVDGLPVAGEHTDSAYPNTVDRYGGELKFEYRPSDTFSADISYTFYTQHDNELRLSQAIFPYDGIIKTSDSTASVAVAYGGVQFNDFPINKPLHIVQGHAQWQPAESQVLSFRASYSQAEWYEPSNELAFMLLPSADNAYVYNWSENGPTFDLVDATAYNDPSNYYYYYYLHYLSKSDEYVNEAQLDYAYNMDAAANGFGFKVGVKYRALKRNYNEDAEYYGANETLTLSDFLLNTNYTAPYFNQKQSIIDFSSFKTYFDANPDAFSLDETESYEYTHLADASLQENVTAGYVMGQYVGADYTVVIGGRIEHTESDIHRFAIQTQLVSDDEPSDYYAEIDDGDEDTRTFLIQGVYNKTRDDFLPSASISYDLNAETKLRAAYAMALGRPNPEDLYENETLSYLGISSSERTISRGNPNLKPRTAQNFDISLEYYMSDGAGMASLGAFYKIVKNEIFTASQIETIDGYSVTVTEPENLEKVTITGLEVNLVRNSLEFLSEYLADFGFSTNATWLMSDVDIPMENGSMRKLDRLLEQPELVANAALFYQAGPLQLRLTYAYTGNYYAVIDTESAANDEISRPYHELDFQGRYLINDHFEWTAEVRNLTDSHREAYTGENLNLPIQKSYYGRQFWTGLSYKY